MAIISFSAKEPPPGTPLQGADSTPEKCRLPLGPTLNSSAAIVRELLAVEPQDEARLIAAGGRLIESLLSDEERRPEDIQVRSDKHLHVHVGGKIEIVDPQGQRISASHVTGILLALWRSRTGAHGSPDPSGDGFRAMDNEFRRLLEETKCVDFACEGGDLMSTVISVPARLRVQAFLEQHGPAATVRVLRDDIPALESLAFDPDIIAQLQKLVARRSGLIFITGQTGAGKSTTLAALIQWLRTNFQRHIVTIEQPIEFRYLDTDDHGQLVNSLITQQEVGIHVADFRTGLVSALRKAPHCIMVGEIRDAETMETALAAAETGHIVFGTLHTRTAPETISRITGFFPPDRHSGILTQLRDSLLCVLSQGLLARKDGKGRVLCYEFFANASAATRSAIGKFLENSTTLNEALLKTGNRSWDVCLKSLFDRGIIDAETYDSNRIQSDEPLTT